MAKLRIPMYFCGVLVEIAQIINESERVKRFFLKDIEGKNFQFIPGQFVTVTAPHLPEMQNTRSYSIANTETVKNELELCIALNEKGQFTPWLFELTVGDQLEISEPVGQFNYLPIHYGSPAVFIATGTGIAPFRSMINSALSQGNRVYLIYGNRVESDILYREYWEYLAMEQSNFTFIPVLSRSSWKGAKGYVHEHYEAILPLLIDPKIFVCGWKDMCVEARNRLKSLGFNRKQYFFEQYD